MSASQTCHIHTGLGHSTPQGLLSTLLEDGGVFPEAAMRGSGGLGHSRLPLLPPTSGTEQMLSHGTADVVLEACTDFWDGADIYPLSGSDRWVRRHTPVLVADSPAVCLPARPTGRGASQDHSPDFCPASLAERKCWISTSEPACLATALPLPTSP